MLIPGSYLLPGTWAPITVQGQAFPPLAHAPMLYCSFRTLFTLVHTAPTALPMYMPSYLPRLQMEQTSTLSEREQLTI